MRQIGLLDSAQEANRFTAYLIVERIRAMVEQEGEKFAVWIREENDLARAKSEFSAFIANPTDARYQNKEREAEAILRADRDRLVNGKKNIVEVKQQSKPLILSRRAPLCLTLLAISIGVTLLHFSESEKMGNPKNPMWRIFFSDFAGFEAFANPSSSPEQRIQAAFSAIARGEVWRLVTPIFIHMDWVHLIFNVWGLMILGSRLETRFGAWRLGLWMLAIAIFSNIAQALADQPLFGGLSGVLYGVFGIAVAYSRASGERSTLVTREESIIYLVWFVMCIVLSSEQWRDAMGEGAAMNIANVAHGAGLFFGLAIGYVMSFMNRQPKGA